MGDEVSPKSSVRWESGLNPLPASITMRPGPDLASADHYRRMAIQQVMLRHAADATNWRKFAHGHIRNNAPLGGMGEKTSLNRQRLQHRALRLNRPLLGSLPRLAPPPPSILSSDTADKAWMPIGRGSPSRTLFVARRCRDFAEGRCRGRPGEESSFRPVGFD